MFLSMFLLLILRLEKNVYPINLNVLINFQFKKSHAGLVLMNMEDVALKQICVSQKI